MPNPAFTWTNTQSQNGLITLRYPPVKVDYTYAVWMDERTTRHFVAWLTVQLAAAAEVESS